jgi:hypothetical protein
MTKIIEVHRALGRPFLGGNLNMRELLNLLFFTPERRHPDRKRQRKARLRALTLRRLRALKTAPVPLRDVDPTVYLVQYDAHLDREVIKEYALRCEIGGRHGGFNA